VTREALPTPDTNHHAFLDLAVVSAICAAIAVEDERRL
jgi:hypothetical protein